MHAMSHFTFHQKSQHCIILGFLSLCPNFPMQKFHAFTKTIAPNFAVILRASKNAVACSPTNFQMILLSSLPNFRTGACRKRMRSSKDH